MEENTSYHIITDGKQPEDGIRDMVRILSKHGYLSGITARFLGWGYAGSELDWRTIEELNGLPGVLEIVRDEQPTTDQEHRATNPNFQLHRIDPESGDNTHYWE